MVDPSALEFAARGYVAGMTSIRGRRVLRLLRREFARYDEVAVEPAEEGPDVFTGRSADGARAACRSDGRGPSASVTRWEPEGADPETVAYDLQKDSLPPL